MVLMSALERRAILGTKSHKCAITGCKVHDRVEFIVRHRFDGAARLSLYAFKNTEGVGAGSRVPGFGVERGEKRDLASK